MYTARTTKRRTNLALSSPRQVYTHITGASLIHPSLFLWAEATERDPHLCFSSGYAQTRNTRRDLQMHRRGSIHRLKTPLNGLDCYEVSKWGKRKESNVRMLCIILSYLCTILGVPKKILATANGVWFPTKIAFSVRN